MNTSEVGGQQHEQAAAHRGFQPRRPHWRWPVAAAVLAIVSVGISLTGYQSVTAEPQYPLTIEVEEPFEDVLNAGITPASIEAAAQGHYTYEPFTFRVTSRELEWSEHQNGEIGEADVLFSIALDRGDSEEEAEEWEELSAEEGIHEREFFSLRRAAMNTVAFDDPEVEYSDRRTVEGAFTNNLTLGHGPSAVVGAAITAGDLEFNGPPRTPMLWVPLAALPLIGAVALMWFWQRARTNYRRIENRFSEAKLMLARVVLELDVLEVRALAAEETTHKAAGQGSSEVHSLGAEWDQLHSDSLRLARLEQQLERLFAGTTTGRKVDDRLCEIAPWAESARDATEQAPGSFAFHHFMVEAAALKERADALTAAAELRAGHAGSQSVLDRLALPLIQAIDELMRCEDQRSGITAMLTPHREQLLALSAEAQNVSSTDGSEKDNDDAAEAQQLAADHADLLKRWGQVEQQMLEDLQDWRSQLPSSTFSYGSGDPAERIEERVRARIRSFTGGAQDSFNELRRTLGLGYGEASGPLYSVEHCLDLLDSQAGVSETAAPAEDESSWWLQASTLVAVVPLVFAVGAGLIAASQVETNTRFGKVLQGDQELAGLEVIGDIDAVGNPVDRAEYYEAMTQTESLELDYIRETMQRQANHGERALLPESLEVTVLLLQLDDFFDYEWEYSDLRDTAHIDYFDLLQGYHQIKQAAQEVNPEVLNSETGEVEQGQGLLPVWLLDDGRYGVGATLTGDISTGVDSRLGSYDFQSTEVRVTDPAEEILLLGDQIAYDLGNLGRAMEYNHQETQQVSGQQVFWLSAVTVWGGVQMLMIIGAAFVEQIGRRFGSIEAHRQLKKLRAQLNELSLGLDLSRLDMVAVLGGDSNTEGRAEEADQRLYEAGLITGLRQVQALERLPRRAKRGEEWMRQVADAQRIIDSLAAREQEASQRAEELLRIQQI